MEQSKKTKAAKKAQRKPTQLEETVKVVLKAPKKSKSELLSNNSKANRIQREALLYSQEGPNYKGKLETAHFEELMLAPDLYGPFRIPRAGGAARTVLGMDRTRLSITGSGTNKVQTFRMSSPYSTNVGATNTSTNDVTALSGAGTDVAFGVQWPPVGYVNIQNLVSASAVISFQGPVLTATGELCMVLLPEGSLNSLTYVNLTQAPGAVSVPIASLMEAPLRICCKKASQASDNFVGVSTATDDLLVPVIASNNQLANSVICIDLIRVFEIIPVTGGSMITDVASGPSMTKDIDAYHDAQALINKAISVITQVVATQGFRLAVNFLSSHLPSFLGKNPQAIIAGMGSFHLQRIGYQNTVYLKLRDAQLKALDQAKIEREKDTSHIPKEYTPDKSKSESESPAVARLRDARVDHQRYYQ